MPLLIAAVFTWPEWISFPLVHCVSLGNVVEFGQAPKLLPDRVVVEEGAHGIVYIPNEALRDRKQSAKKYGREEKPAQELMQ